MFEPDEPGWCRECRRQNDDHSGRCSVLIGFLDRLSA